MYRFLTILPFLILTFMRVDAQQIACHWTVDSIYKAPSPRKFFENYAGWAYNGVRDEGMSQLYYRGHSFLAGLAYERTLKTHYRINLEGQIGSLSPAGNTSSAVLYRLNASYQQYHCIYCDKRSKWFIGGSLDNWLSIRDRIGFSNSSFNYDHFTAISLGSYFSRWFEFKDRYFKTRVSLSLPFMALALRPSYGFPVPEEFQEDDDKVIKRTINSSRVTSFNKFFRLHTKLGLTYYLKNGNAFRLSYRWEYYSYNHFEANKLQAASHNIFFSTLFKL